MPKYFTLASATSSFFGSIGAVAVRPKSFFENMKGADSYRDSLIFLFLILLVPTLIDSYLISQEKMHTIFPALEGLGLLLGWFWAGYLYWCVKLFTKNEMEHTTAFQLAAYSSVPLLLDFSAWLIVPAYIWQLVITWKGLVNHVGLPHDIASWLMIVPVIMLASAIIAFVMMAALSGIDLISPLLYEDYTPPKPFQ